MAAILQKQMSCCHDVRHLGNPRILDDEHRGGGGVSISPWLINLLSAGLIFHPLEVVSRYCDPPQQMAENYS